jgi:hypothetical protein
MKKPSERIMEIKEVIKDDYYSAYLKAILQFLDEEAEKKEVVLLTCKKGQESEYEAIKNEIKREVIKEFVEKIMKRKITTDNLGVSKFDVVLCYKIIMVLKEYGIE